MAPPNLTRADAERRAALLDVADYAVELDLTDGGGKPGDATFTTTTTVRFGCRQPGAASWIDFVGAEVASAVLNGVALDVSGYREEDGIALPDLAAENELTVVGTGRYMNTGEGLHRFVDPVDGGVYLYSQFETADAKRLFACFDQPDLKARYRLTVTAPADWQVVSNAQVEEAGRRARRRGHAPVRDHRDHVDVPGRARGRSVRALARRVHRRERRRRHDPARDLLPRLARRAHGRRAAVHRDQAGLRVLPPPLRRPVPVREVRPAVRARVQRRRDGERRCGDVPRGLRLPLPRHPLPLRAARRDRAARDGAHVVRRPRDDALVGRPVAQRVVRHLGVGALPGRGHRVPQRLDHVRQRREELGLPAGPAALDAPGRLRHPRRAGRRGQLRRHHVRQGRLRCSSSSSRTSGWSRSSPACAATSAPTPGATRPSTTSSARWRRRPGATCPAGARSGCGRRASTCCSPRSSSTTRAGSPGSRSYRAARAPAPGSCGRTGSPSGSTTTTRPPTTARARSWSAPTASRSTSPGSAPRSPSWSASAAASSCSSTTTTSPTARCGWTRRRSRRSSTASATSPTRCRGRCAGRRPGR